MSLEHGFDSAKPAPAKSRPMENAMTKSSKTARKHQTRGQGTGQMIHAVSKTGDLDTLAGPINTLLTPALVALIAEVQAARVEYGAASLAEDIKSGRKERAALRRAEERDDAAIKALLAYTPADISELAAMSPIVSLPEFVEATCFGNSGAEWISGHVQRLASKLPAPFPPSGADDALHALIADHKAIWDRAEAAPIETRREERANDRRWTAAHQVMDRIEAFEPQTSSGLTAKAAHVLRWAAYTACPGEAVDLSMCEAAAASVLRDVVRLGAAFGPSQPFSHSANTTALSEAWAAASERSSSANLACERAQEALSAAELAAESEIDALEIPADIRLSDGTAMHSSELEALKGLPDAARSRLAALIEGYWVLRDAVYEKHRVNDLDEELLAADREAAAARELVLALEPRSPGWFLVQMQMVALRQHRINVENPEDVRAALSAAPRVDASRHAQEFIQLYRHACRLAGFDSATAAVTPWDANEFIDQFERHPGHYMTRRGPLWIEFEMPGYISDGEVAIRDPDRIRKYDALCGRSTRGRHLASGIVVTDIDRLREVYADDPESGERLIKVVERYQARDWMKDWAGSAMWSSLADWQKEAVREAMLHRVDREQVRRLVEGATRALVDMGPPADFAETVAAVDEYLGQQRGHLLCEPWEADIEAARAQLLDHQPLRSAAE